VGKTQPIILSLVCAGVLLLLCAPFLGPVGAFAGVAGALDLVIAGAYAWMVRLKRDPYSIQALRGTIEREELDEIEEPTAVAEKFLCLRCGQEIDARLGVCPKCGNPV
jgi:hypothetical protein